MYTMIVVLIGIAIVVTFSTVPQARTHLATHHEDPPDAYKCPQCGDIDGGMRRMLQTALVVALVIIYAAIEMRGV